MFSTLDSIEMVCHSTINVSTDTTLESQQSYLASLSVWALSTEIVLLLKVHLVTIVGQLHSSLRLSFIGFCNLMAFAWGFAIWRGINSASVNMGPKDGDKAAVINIEMLSSPMMSIVRVSKCNFGSDKSVIPSSLDWYWSGTSADTVRIFWHYAS